MFYLHMSFPVLSSAACGQSGPSEIKEAMGRQPWTSHNHADGHGIWHMMWSKHQFLMQKRKKQLGSLNGNAPLRFWWMLMHLSTWIQGATGIIHDDRGQVIAARSKWYEALPSVIIVEALACWDRGDLAHNMNMSKVIMKTDSLELINLWSSS